MQVPLGPMAAHLSDLTYKSHLLRLSEAYTEYKPSKEMDYKNFSTPIIAPSGPAVQLYGVKGLTRLSPRSQERVNRERQQGWNSRFTAEFDGLHTIQRTPDPREILSSKKGKLGLRRRSESPSFDNSDDLKVGSTPQSSQKSPPVRGKENKESNHLERFRPSSSSRKTRSAIARDDSSGDKAVSSADERYNGDNRDHTDKNANNSSSISRNNRERSKEYAYNDIENSSRAKRNVCWDKEVGVEELIMKGNYRFRSDEDKDTYGRFVDMLSAYDPYEMVKILEDAMRDAQDRTLLDEYGGF